MIYVVTVRRRECDQDHDPRAKVCGPCPFSGKECTDSTGRHHSYVLSSELDAQSVQDVVTSRLVGTRWRVSRVERTTLMQLEDC